MVTMSRWDVGEHETLCGHVQVETAEECQCGCVEGGEDCVSDLQYYHRPSCSCLCHNQHQRAQCLARGGSWSPTTCTCSCPDTWHLCPTGYQYDYMTSCSCVQVHAAASITTIVVVIVLLLTSLLILSSLGWVHTNSIIDFCHF